MHSGQLEEEGHSLRHSILVPCWNQRGSHCPAAGRVPSPGQLSGRGGGVSPLAGFNYTPMITIASSAAQGGRSPSENALSIFDARNSLRQPPVSMAELM